MPDDPAAEWVWSEQSRPVKILTVIDVIFLVIIKLMIVGGIISALT